MVQRRWRPIKPAYHIYCDLLTLATHHNTANKVLFVGLELLEVSIQLVQRLAIHLPHHHKHMQRYKNLFYNHNKSKCFLKFNLLVSLCVTAPLPATHLSTVYRLLRSPPYMCTCENPMCCYMLHSHHICESVFYTHRYLNINKTCYFSICCKGKIEYERKINQIQTMKLTSTCLIKNHTISFAHVFHKMHDG